MVTAVRIARVFAILLLAILTTSMIIGLVRAETGPVEKVVLVGLIAGCFLLAGWVSSVASRAQDRLQRH